jgi:uncharacterized protein
LVRGIADAIAAAAHARAAPAPTEPWIQSIPLLIADNTATLLAASVPRPIVDLLDDASRSAFARIRDLLTQRGEMSYVRHCHRDLHLGNIVMIERKPVLFDAIDSIRRLRRPMFSPILHCRSWISCTISALRSPLFF